MTSKSFNCSPHASHSGLQWLLGVTCGDQFPLVTCEDYTNVALENDFLTSLINSVRPQYIVIRLNVVVLLNSQNLQQPENCSSIDFDFRLLSFSKKGLAQGEQKV